jgi:Mrp family chromosome partitioning ATPase
MTRLFDALNKGRPAVPAWGPAPPPAPLPVAAPPRAPWKTAQPAAMHPAVPVDGARCQVVSPGAIAELPPDVLREMTALRISLEAALTQRIPRVVMFLAAQGGEGTSTVAAQYAQSLASDERLRVLLADAQVLRPAYRADGSPVESRPVRAALRRHGQDESRGPDLMPLPGDSPEARALTPGSLRASLDVLASGYDWIVLDGPPVLEMPDAATLAGVADGVVVVVQAGRTKRPVLARTVDLVSRAGGRVLGVVLNRRRLEIPGFIYRRI